MIRWGSETDQTCPHCAVSDSHRYVPAQRRWKCRHCYKAFSVTSGTVLNSHKLPLQKILGAMLLYANAVKGMSALQLSRDLDVQYKTAFVLLHKLRETLFKTRDTDLFKGKVEIDGGYMHTYVRPKNKSAVRPDLRVVENQNPNKCLILVLRELYPRKPKKHRHDRIARGAKRTRTFIIGSENAVDVMAIVKANIDTSAHIVTDEASAYTLLSARYNHSVVNHSAEYRADDGANENQAESYFGRFRRMCMGQIHRLNRKYLDVYANEVAFREDWRRIGNGEFLRELLSRCLRTPPSSDWTKYWQGNKRTHDSVVRYG